MKTYINGSTQIKQDEIVILKSDFDNANKRYHNMLNKKRFFYYILEKDKSLKYDAIERLWFKECFESDEE